MTPVLVLGARSRGVDEAPFLYAAVYMANASSLYLPGSNLTNLLVVARDPLPGSKFAERLLAPALAATIATALGLWLLFRRELDSPLRVDVCAAHERRPVPGGLGVGALATAAAAGLTLVLAHPAPAVLAVGVLATTVQITRGGLTVRAVIRALGPAVIVLLFAVSVALGMLARVWDGRRSCLPGRGVGRRRQSARLHRSR